MVRTTHYSPRTGFFSGTGRGDGSLIGADGRARDPVVQALAEEAPGDAGEPAGAADDRRRFLDVEDTGHCRRRGYPGEFGNHRVAVRRRDLVVPTLGPGRAVHEVRSGECKPAELGRHSCRVDDYKVGL